MSLEGQKSIGLKVLGLCIMFISIASFGVLILVNIIYKGLFSLAYNIIFFFYSSVLFISSVGVILLKTWARILLIIISWIKIAEGIIKVVNYIINDALQIKLLHLLGQFTNIFIFSLIIFFLSRKSIKNQFTINE